MIVIIPSLGIVKVDAAPAKTITCKVTATVKMNPNMVNCLDKKQACMGPVSVEVKGPATSIGSVSCGSPNFGGVADCTVVANNTCTKSVTTPATKSTPAICKVTAPAGMTATATCTLTDP